MNYHSDISCFQISNGFSGKLSSVTINGTARRQALTVLSQRKWERTDIVSYRSAGKLLIIDRIQQDGDPERAIAIAKHLVDDSLLCTVLIDGVKPDSRDQVCRGLSTRKITVVAGKPALLQGFLGCFTAHLDGPHGSVDLAELGPSAGEYFDLVLDLGTQAFLQHEVLPPGYFAPGEDPEELQDTLQELPRMTGEFIKPVYVNYQANICTHGNKGITGCTRCLDICPAEAIRDKGEKIEVETSLCQGCGGCIMACPTGALSYRYPTAREWLLMIRDILKAYRDMGGSHPGLLIYDDKSASVLEAYAETLPDNLIPVPVEEIGSVGMDGWLTALAYGADSVGLLIDHSVPQHILTLLRSQFAVTHSLLTGMGYTAERLYLVEIDQDNTFVIANKAEIYGDGIPTAGFDPFEKHRTIRFALDHLYRHAPQPQASTILPAGALFGEVRVDQNTCTLCMSCARICPVNALSHDNSEQELSFLESDCVQCGLCRNACPENSISLVSRYVYDENQAGTARVLIHDELYRCIACGKPFISKRMLEMLTDKLAATGNWKIDKDIAPDWLKMCGDCRIKDPS